jgi:hypothetical protein
LGWRGRRGWGRAAFALALALASLGTVEKYLGTPLAVVYLLAMFVAVPLLDRLLPRFVRLVREGAARWLTWATFGAVVLAFVFLYPIADRDEPNAGSDRDEAANIAIDRLLDGDYPYDELTYLGNPVSQMPGALLFGAPFRLLGNSAYQNLFWLPVLVLVLARRTRSPALALFACWTLLVLSPEVMREIVTGGDLLANCIYVALLMLAVVVTGREGRSFWLGVAAALALGIAYSSRANFLFTVPILAGMLWQRHGPRVALARLAAAAAAFAAVTLPFYLHDPDGFTPTRTSGKLSQFDDLVPNLHLIILAAVGLLAVALAVRRFDPAGLALMSRASAVQIAFLVTVVVLDSIESDAVDFSFLVPGFGLIALAFAALGTWPPWSDYRAEPATSS